MTYSRHSLNEGQKQHDAASEHEVPHSSSPTRSTTTRRSLLTGWTWSLECIFLVLAIGALAALVTVILTVQDESIGAWRGRHPNVSINSIVAILSALLTGSCMFVVGQVMGQSKWQWFREPHSLTDFARIDRASRGPWGSLLLLCRLRVPILARVAAITTLVAMAVNPFAQNMIATRECQIPSVDEEIVVPTADAYAESQGMRQVNGNPSPSDFSLWGVHRFVAHADMKASVYSGIWGAPTTAVSGPIIYLSSTSIGRRFPNRLYPRYTTLGICHACADISSSVEKACNSTNPENDGGVFSPRCRWSLPTEQSLHNFADSETYKEYMNGNIDDISINFAMVNSTSSTLALPHVPGTFTNVTFLVNATSDPECTTRRGNACGNGYGVPTTELQTIAAECSLFPCARTYTASVVNGSLVETEVKRTTGKGDWLSNIRPNATYRSPTKIIIDPEETCTSTEWSTDTLHNETYPCTFDAHGNFIMSLGDFFWGFWNGTVTGRHFHDSVSTNDILDAFYQGGLTNFTQIDRVLGNVADSMTATIRRTGRVYGPGTVFGGSGQGIVTRQALKFDACVELRWGWIALPATVVAATAVLLVWAVISSRKSTGQPVWKASALPILSHGPDTTNFRGDNKLSTLKDMEKEASDMRMKLSDPSMGPVRVEVARP